MAMVETLNEMNDGGYATTTSLSKIGHHHALPLYRPHPCKATTNQLSSLTTSIASWVEYDVRTMVHVVAEQRLMSICVPTYCCQHLFAMEDIGFECLPLCETQAGAQGTE